MASRQHLSDSQARQEVIEATIKLEQELYGADLAHAKEIRRDLEALDATRLAETHQWSGTTPSKPILKWPAPNVPLSTSRSPWEMPRPDPRSRTRSSTRHDADACHRPSSQPLLEAPHHRPGRRPSAKRGGPIATIEGGDVQVLSPEVVLIGVGPRTTMDAVKRLAPKLFERGVEVVSLEMPRRRAAMHIDTLHTH